jgi:hypothetical protein
VIWKASMNRFFAAIIALLAGAAQAHDCDPPATTCIGTAARTVSTPAGDDAP